MNEEYKKEVCQCRKCGEVFHQSDVKTIQTERYGLIINEKICPYCGSNTYGLVEYPVSEERLIYNYSNFPSELIKHLNEITNQILREDAFVLEVNNERKMAMA